MAVRAIGVHDHTIHDCPIAVIDFETTGLTPGFDRVVEVSVVRIEPRKPPCLVFDTLINPRRRVAATEIHGISDDDVADAPTFEDIAGELLTAVSGCVIAAYNVYFDVRFLANELRLSGVCDLPPHFCLMYMRPLLGLGSRCRLDEACQSHGIAHDIAHIAAADAMASAQLLTFYLQVMTDRRISKFADLAALKDYKFLDSFSQLPFLGPERYRLGRCHRLKSRNVATISAAPVDSTRKSIAKYWDVLKTILADLRIDDEEMDQITKLRNSFGLKEEQVRMLHARAFASAIMQFTDDRWLSDREAIALQRLYGCLRQLGWAPGQ